MCGGLSNRDDDSLREGIQTKETWEESRKYILENFEHARPLRSATAFLVGDFNNSPGRHARARIRRESLSTVRSHQARPFRMRVTVRGRGEKDTYDLEIVRLGDLPHIQKTWALTQAAKLVYKNDLEKAVSLLEQADLEARRIETSNEERPRAFMAIASTYLLVDRGKAWDQVSNATKAANSAPTFSGEDGVLRVSLLTKGMSSIRTSSAREFDVAPVFSDLAKEDYARTIELARS